MIKKLRHKFIFVVMCVATVILLAVFTALLLSTWGTNKRIGENILKQAVSAQQPQGFLPPQGQSGMPPFNNMEGQPEKSPFNNMETHTGAGSPPASPPGGRTSILIAEISDSGSITILINQLHYIETEEAEEAVKAAINAGGEKGVLHGYGLRWLKSFDGGKIALADISMEQEVMNNLIINALAIGLASLVALFLISILLSRWAVKPVADAWERQRQFVADASHELKTPLTVILSNADMLRNTTFADGKASRRVEHIQAEAGRMKKLIEDLLLLARSDNASTQKIRECVDFSYIVANAVLTFEPIIFDGKKKLTYDISDNLSVTGDPQRLQQLTGILLDNALKYCPTNGDIFVVLEETDKKSLLLTVSSDGDPIPKDELTLVFDRFYRADKSRSGDSGFGLGLSIARAITAEHSGKIWAESKAGSGNSFFVILPLC